MSGERERNIRERNIRERAYAIWGKEGRPDVIPLLHIYATELTWIKPAAPNSEDLFL